LSEKDSGKDKIPLYACAAFLGLVVVWTLFVGIVIPLIDILIIIVILVLLLSDKFSVFKIPHLLEMRKEVETLKQGQQELVHTTQALIQTNATLQQSISSIQQNNVNITITQPQLERTVERTEQLLESSGPQPRVSVQRNPEPEASEIREFYQRGQNVAAFQP
jgi:hypothetical protein